MAKLTVQQIRSLARSIIARNSGGIRYSALVENIFQQSPETPKNTIHGSVWNLDALLPNEISKPSRGLFVPVEKPTSIESPAFGSTEQIAQTGIKVKEADFYAPFAEWLRNDLDEVTEVAPLGGAGLKSKWGTPDVVGIYKPLASNLIKFPIEIVSAEIKIESSSTRSRVRSGGGVQVILNEDLHRDANYSYRRRPEPPRIALYAFWGWVGLV